MRISMPTAVGMIVATCAAITYGCNKKASTASSSSSGANSGQGALAVTHGDAVTDPDTQKEVVVMVVDSVVDALSEGGTGAAGAGGGDAGLVDTDSFAEIRACATATLTAATTM